MRQEPTYALSHQAIRKFQAGTWQSDAEVIQQFGVRQRELGIILEVLRRNIGMASCQHLLLIAPRGQGKTMLLARIAAELRTNDQYPAYLWPVWFMGGNHEISCMADFWLAILYNLGQESALRDPGLARTLRSAYESLVPRHHERDYEEYARATVLQAVDRLGRQLVLMVEDFQDLCRNVDDHFGWKLRKMLQVEAQIMLLATATCRFPALDDAAQPFFELFRIINLNPLSAPECRRLWQKISGARITVRECRPLEILTDRNPRYLAIVAGFARHRAGYQLMEALAYLIDDLTDYFRGGLRSLAKTERRVFLALLDLWQPSHSGEIAARAHLDVRTVSTMLGRLADRGAVTVEGSGRKRRYAATERLYCLYYKLQRERDEAGVVHRVIRFMAAFYRNGEPAHTRHPLRWEAMASAALRAGIARAIAETPERVHVLPGIGQSAVNPATGSPKRTACEWREADMLPWNKGAVQTALAIFAEAMESLVAVAACEDQSPLAGALAGKAALHEQVGEYEKALKICAEAITHFAAGDIPEFPHAVSIALACALVAQAKRRVKPNAQPIERDTAQAAISDCESVIALCSVSDARDLQVLGAEAMVFKGLLHGEIHETADALAMYKEVAECFGGRDILPLQTRVAQALLYKALLHLPRDEVAAALSACDQAIKRFGGSQAPELQCLVTRVLALKADVQTVTCDVAGALRTCNDLERQLARGLGEVDNEPRERIWQVAWLRTRALIVGGGSADAMHAFRSAYALFEPENDDMMRTVLSHVPEFIACGASPLAVADILTEDTVKSLALFPLVLALQRLGGRAIRAPVEVMSVVADICDQIKELQLGRN